MVALLKKDALKLVVFVGLYLLVQGLGRVFNPLGGALLAVCFLVLEGILPYLGQPAKLLLSKQPFIVFVIAGFVLWLLPGIITWPVWMMHLFTLLEATLFFLLVMAVLENHSYTLTPLKNHWSKWLVVLVVFYVTQFFVLPFVMGHVLDTPAVWLGRLIVPLLYIGTTYALRVCVNK